MKKYIDYLNSVGSLVILGSFVWCLIAHHNLHVARYFPTFICLFLGVLMTLPLACYKMWHFKRYKSENILDIIIIALIIIFLLVYVNFFR